MNTPKSLKHGSLVVVKLAPNHLWAGSIKPWTLGTVTFESHDLKCLGITVVTRNGTEQELLIDNRQDNNARMWEGTIIRYVGDGKLWQRDKYRKGGKK